MQLGNIFYFVISLRQIVTLGLPCIKTPSQFAQNTNNQNI